MIDNIKVIFNISIIHIVGMGILLILPAISSAQISGNIVVMPEEIRLDRGSSTVIRVSLSRIESGNVTVTVTTDGDVTVSSQTLTFNSTAAQTLTVDTTDMPGYAQARSATVTLTATGYTTRTVMVNIRDDELPSIDLVVTPPPGLDLVRFATAEIEVTAEQASTLTIVTQGAVSLVSSASQTLSAGVPVRIEILGSGIGAGTVTFTVSSPGFADAVETVRVTVRTPTLMFSPAIATDIELAVGEEADLSVTVVAESGDAMGGVTLTATVIAGTVDTVTVSPLERLNVPLNESRMFMVDGGDNVGDAMIRITASHPDYEDAIAAVRVNVLSTLSIGTDVDRLNVTEGDSADIRVSLSRIESGNVTVTVTTDGDVTAPQELTFDSTAAQTLSVDAADADDDRYTGTRSATVTLTATGYTTRTVMVNIRDDELPSIDLVVTPPPGLDLVRFATAEIEVTAEQASTLTIVTQGAVSLVSSASQTLSAGVPVRIEILGSGIGAGTVTFTVSSPGFADAVETVRVTVRTPTLMFSPAIATDIELAVGEEADLSVTVVAESGDAMGGVTLTATVIAGTVDTVTVSPLERLNVPLNESRMFMVDGGDNVGDAMIRITASHPDYEDAIAAVRVNVLSTLSIGTDVDRLNVTEGDSADISVSLSRIESGNVTVTVTTDGDVTAPQELTFDSTAAQTLSVDAADADDDRYTGTRSATVTLTATGYTTRTVMVNIRDDELPSIDLVVTPPPGLDLVRFATAEIEVTAEQASTLTIVTQGAVSLVSSASQTLSAGVPVRIEILGSGIGAGTVTFTVSSPGFADAVETVRVTVRTPTLMFSPAIATDIELAVGEEADLSVTVVAESGDAMGGVTLTATVIAGTVDTVTVSPLERLNVPLNESRMFMVDGGDNVGDAMIRITASHPDYEDAIAAVRVNVLSTLSIGTDVDRLNVTEGDSADISVSLSRIESGNVTVTVTTDGDVTAPQELTFDSTAAQTLSVDAADADDDRYTGTRSATVTLTATGYTTRTVMVNIRDDELPSIDLVVTPPPGLDLVRFATAEIEVTAEQASTLTIVTQGAVSLVSSASQTLSAGVPVRIEILGSGIGAGTVTFTVSSPGFADAVETVRVTVRTPTLMFSPAIATDIELAVGEEADLSVTVVAESGDAMGGVTLTATVIAGTVDTVTVSPLERLNVPLNESRMFMVDGGDNVGDAMIRITASHPDYEDAIAAVRVNVLSTLSIGTDVDRLNVTEGDSADIRVSLSRIESGNVTVTVTTDGDVTAPQELTFDSTAAQTLSVDAADADDDRYTGTRSATVTLTATGYTTRTVMVNIRDDELPSIDLVVTPPPGLDLVRFATAEIEVTAEQASTLTIVTQGAVSLVSSASQTLSAGVPVRIEILGSGIGAGTVTFTVSSPGFADAVETVRVTVRTPTLMFSPAIATDIELAVGEEADLSVTVVAESGDAMGGVTLTATVIAGTVDTVTVSPLERLNVPLNESRMFMVDGGDNVGDAMIRITASHPDYEDAIAAVRVNVLSTLSIGTDVDRLNVTEGDSADIRVSLSRIESGNVTVTVTTDGDVTAPQELTFDSTAAQTLSVDAADADDDRYTGTRSATVTLTATGYTTRTVMVNIRDDELPSIDLVVTPPPGLDLVRFATAEIEVTAEQASTLTIVTQGAVSLVSSASQTLSAGVPVRIEILGSGIGAGTVTFTVSSPGFADAVETVRVTVRTPTLMFSPAIATDIELAVGEEADLSVTVVAESGDAMGGVTLTATVIAGTVDTVTVSPLERLNVPLNESRMFMVDGGDNVGDAMIRITASHPDYEDAIAAVRVNVLSTLSIGTDVDRLNVTEGDSADISVSLSRIESGNVTVTVTTDGDVTAPQELTFDSTAAQTLSVDAADADDDRYTGTRSATVTLTATGYTTRTVMVNIRDDELPSIDLVVTPPPGLDLVRFATAEIEVTAEQASTLTIVTQGAVSLVSSASQTLSAGVPVRIEILGSGIGAGTVTFTVSSPGFADAVETVRVTVRTPTLMFSPAIATDIELAVGEEADLSVTVVAESGDAMGGVTLTATVIAGTVDTVTVSPLERLNVPLNESRMFMVDGGDNVGDAMIRITASHPDYEDAIAAVRVNVLSTLSIGTDVDRLNVTEGDSADIRVSLSRIESGNVTVTVTTDGDVTAPQELTFDSTAAQTLSVDAADADDDRYTGTRSATVTLTATGYTTRTVMVNIRDDELPSIDLVVTPPPGLDLVRFATAEIEVTAEQASTLTIVTQGAVSLVSSASQTLSAGVPVRIEILGSGIGAGTVTFTVSSPGFADAVETVRVTVRTPTLMFSPAIATDIELAVGEEADLSVTVVAESGDAMGGVTLTATVIAGTVDTVTVSPLERLNVPLNESRMFMVDGGDNVGDAMIRITASHPDYEDAIAAVRVNVLSTLSIGTDVDRLNVTEGDSADIRVSLSRIESGNVTVTVTTDGDVTAPQELTFDSTAAQTLSVDAADADDDRYTGTRSATVTLTATGYTTRTVMVNIRDDELPSIDLVVTPPPGLDLVRFATAEIEVTAEQASTLTIVTQGAVSLVSSASQTLSAGVPVRIEILGSGIGAGTVTFTVSSPGFADAVETVRVTVRTPTLMFSPAIATDIELAVGEEADLSVTVVAESGDAMGGVTLTATVIAGTVDTVTVSPLERLNVPLNESRMFMVDGGDNVGDAMIRITASHPDYEDAIAAVRVNVLSTLSIGTDVDRLNVTEGDSADIRVSLSRIESGNVTVTVTTDGDVTAPQELTFDSTAAQTLSVDAADADDDRYTGTRSATVTLTATGYTTRTVMVNIRDDELPSIDLVVTPPPGLDLVRFATAEIEVTAEQASTLTIVTQGAVSLVSSASQTLSAGVPVRIEILGSGIGAGTVTFTVSSPGFADAVETVRVTVRTPTLMFSPAIATDIELAVGEEADLSVTVVAESGDAMGGVTLTATVIAGTVDTVTVSPLERLNVPLNESRMFMVDGGDNVGDAMIRITASHPDYEDAIAAVRVNVLSTLSIGTDVDRLNVTEGDSADISVSLSRIESGNVTVTVTTDGDVTAPQELTFDSTAAQTLSVDAADADDDRYTGTRSATVTLTATGYTTRTVMVNIRDDELPSIDLVVTPPPGLDLVRFATAEIEVTAEQASTLTIVTQGAVSLVSSASQTLSAGVPVRIEILGSGIGAGTVTFTVSSPGFADAVETVRVTVRTPTLMFSPAIATDIELAVGEEADLSVTVVAESGDAMGGVTLTATVIAGTVDTVTVSPLERLNVPLNESRMFMVDGGDNVGDAMIRITASHPDYEDAIAAVRVNVLSTLSIGTDVDRLNVTEGDSADISVSLSRIESGNVTVTVTTDGDVTAPQELTFDSTAAQTLSVDAADADDDRYTGTRSATVTLTATGYTTRTVMVNIRDDELPSIDLVVTPPPGLDLVRFATAEIEVTAEQASTLTIVTQGAVSLVSSASQTLSAGVPVRIEILGSGIGAGTVTFTVSSPGFADAVETVRVTVRTPTLMFSPAIATDIELAVGEEADLSVTVVAESGDAMGGVTLTATVIAGTVDTVTVSPLERLNVPLNESRMFMVDGGDNVGDAMIRITASHPDYEDAIAAVRVNVLSTLSIGTDVDRLNVTEGDSADIRVSLSRIESGNVTVTVTTDGDVTAPQELTFDSTAAQTLSVDAADADDDRYTGTRSATVTLTATGYTTRTVMVNIRDDELPSIDLVVTPPPGLDLVRFATAEIEVTAEQASTLTIVTQGAVSLVSSASQTLSAGVPVRIEILGSGIGAGTVTFTVSSPGFADAVETVRVTVRTPTLMFSPAIATDIELAVGEEADLSVTVVAESGDAMGGVTLTATVIAGTVDTVTVSPLERLNVPLNESRMFMVDGGDNVGDAMIRITASHPDYEDAIAAVRVNVLSTLSIGTDVDRLNVTEGDSADIRVSLSRIESGNVTVTVTTDGDVTAPQELTFDSTAAQTLSVDAADADDDRYTGTRSATVTLTATGYTTRTVMVNIRDDELPSIDLVVTPPPGLDLVRFATAEIEVTAEQASTLTIVTQGAVSLVSSASQTLSAGVPVRIEILGSGIGAGTVTFTVSSPGFADAVETVRVTVRTPTLMFSPAIATDIELAVGEEADLSVTVVAESGDAMGGVTLTATVIAGTVDTVTVSPLERLNVPLNESRMFMVDGGDNVGDAMIRITASHPDYEDAIAAVRVNVLSTLSIGTDVDRLNVTEGDSADISVSLSRIESGNVTVTVTTDGDVTAPQELTFDSTAAQTLSVDAADADDDRYTGTRSATVTLTATGYTTRTVMVNIRDDELPSIDLVVTPPPGLDLVRFATAEIEVTAEQASTLTIVTQGAVSLVSSASQTLSAGVPVRIEILGSGIGAGTVTFTVSSPGFADAVETVRVTVRTPTLMFSPAIATDIELAVGEEADLSVTVVAESGDAMGGVTLTATVIAGTVDTVTVSPLERLNVPLNESRMFMVDGGDNVGDAMIRITASHPDYEDAIAAVRVNVLSTLSIGTDVDRLNVTEGDSADISVSLSRIESGNVTVTVTTDGDVTAPQELTFDSTAAQTLSVDAADADDDRYTGTRSATVTLTATGYTTRTVMVNIRDDELPSIDLVVTPPPGLDLVRFATAEIEVTAEQASTLTIVTQGAVSLVSSASQTLSAGVPVRIEILGSGIGAGTVTFTVSSPGFADAVETVRVTVRTPTLMFSPAIATDIELAVGEEADLSVTVVAESGDAMGGVTLTATVIAGTVDTVTVSPLERLNVPLNESRMFMVDGGDNVGDAMIRITASHPDYEDAIAAVRVNVLSTLSIGTDVDRLNVTEGDSADISVSLSRIESGNVTVTVTTDGDVTAPQELTFDSTAAQTLSVDAADADDDRYTGTRSATVTLTATGYTTRTVMVNIRDDELPSIDLVVTPPPGLDLVRFATAEIEVTAEQASTLTIVTQGAVSLVSSASQTLSAGVPVRIEILGSGIGAGTVTFTVSSPGFADSC